MRIPKRHLLKNTWKNRTLLLMCMPAILIMILFHYVPMYGLVLAFKKFDYTLGFQSPWCGLSNIRYIFLSGEGFWRITRNTVLYYILFTVTGLAGKILLAIGINEFVCKRLGKYLQSAMILPTFISYIAVSFIVYALLKNQTGLLNQIKIALGAKSTNYYLEPSKWPVILLIVKSWKDIGYGSVLYLSVLAGIDPNLYEAASLDGANARQKMRYITLPMLSDMAVITTLMGLGHIMNSDTGLFYQVTKNVGALYPTTQVLDSYVLDAIMKASNYSTTAATTLYQSVIGCIMLLITNRIIRKTNPEKALF